MRTVNSVEKILMLGKIEGRRKGWKRIRWLDGIIDSADVSLRKLQEIVKDGEAWHATVHRESDTTLGLNSGPAVLKCCGSISKKPY